MKRHAVIVVTPNCPGENPLPGATEDAIGWKHFLTSPEGGAWVDEEITILVDPSRPKLMSYLMDLRVIHNDLDYALLTFSGHGQCVDTNHGREARLYLSSNDFVTEATYTLKGKRELLILDACRELRDERTDFDKIANKAVMLTNSAESNIAWRLEESRRKFADALATNPLGRSLVYSCDVNEIASDLPSFTKVLIKESAAMARKTPDIRVLTINDVFPAAAAVARSFKQPQNPVYEAGRRMTHLPFAVSV